jgi:transitional endoplasmic reticulum ATPase
MGQLLDREAKSMRLPQLEITFGQSPSIHYARAVRLAQGLAGYRVTGKGKDITHSLALTTPLEDDTTWEQLRQLMRLVSAWRSASVRVAGQVTGFWTLSGRLKQVKACYAQKLQQGAGDEYCSGKRTPTAEAAHFGCRFAKGVSRRLPVLGQRPNSWIDYGSLAPGLEAFRVDQQAIFTVLERQTRTEACVFCPAFSWKRVRAEVDDLPEVIDLGGESPFEVRYAESNPKKALGIQRKYARELDEAGLWLGSDHREREAEPSGVRSVPNVRYADIAGQDTALQALQSVVQLPLTQAAYFEALGVVPHSGIVLYGPPGNGKTLLAKAVATESNAQLEIISGPEILSRWVGQSEEHLRRVFARARQFAPSIVLLDELDSIAPRRERASQHHDVQLLSQLLVLLDGLETRGRVAVVATTNRLEAIDPALLRPGRFDYHIEMPRPDQDGRAAILRLGLGKLKTRRSLRVEEWVAPTEGFSGAELAALCREAGMQAIQRGLAHSIAARRLVVTRQDVCRALAGLRAKRVADQP